MILSTLPLTLILLTHTLCTSASTSNRRDDNKPPCGKNQYYTPCGPTCPYSHCTGEGEGTIVCINTLVCVAGCFCEQGFYRNCEGNCVLERECKKSDDCGILLPDFDYGV
ncbi:hypothetical protein BDV12DRAFT_171058 [Aspergillus spectabilis]